MRSQYSGTSLSGDLSYYIQDIKNQTQAIPHNILSNLRSVEASLIRTFWSYMQCPCKLSSVVAADSHRFSTVINQLINKSSSSDCLKLMQILLFLLCPLPIVEISDSNSNVVSEEL